MRRGRVVCFAEDQQTSKTQGGQWTADIPFSPSKMRNAMGGRRLLSSRKMMRYEKGGSLDVHLAELVEDESGSPSVDV